MAISFLRSPEKITKSKKYGSVNSVERTVTSEG